VLIALTVAVIALMGGGVGALYAYDSSKADVIATGMRVGGIDIGGMPVAEARFALEQRLASPLRRPMMIEGAGREFSLSPEAAGVEVDIESMLGEALAKSRGGTFIHRAIRDLTDGVVRDDIALRVTYSRDVVRTLVSRIERELERPAKNARLVPSAIRLRVVRSRNGLAVRTRALEKEIASRLVSPDAARIVEIATKVVKPRLTTAELVSRYPRFITISRKRFELRLFGHLKLVKVYRIGIGRIGYETPAGLYRIRNKAANPAWYVPNESWTGSLAGKIIPPGPDNPIKARWLGFFHGRGIHGTAATDSIGRAASHGCIRMTIPDVIELYDRIPLRTPLYIA
jgi:lipoprotein-anchoring transpeptidase ErfK/SrfK